MYGSSHNGGQNSVCDSWTRELGCALNGEAAVVPVCVCHGSSEMAWAPLLLFQWSELPALALAHHP